MGTYSLRKSRSILRQYYHRYLKRKKTLSPEASESIKNSLIALQEAVINKDREKACEKAKKLDQASKIHLKRTLYERITGNVFGLLAALVFAIIIRQMAFENMEIPTGSMRPTFKEKDCLIISRTQFGLNVPLMTSHFYFDPTAVKRMAPFTFTTQNMDVRGNKTRHFYIFPGYKQMIKRMIGLPGDSLYFYGGKIYGIDKEGKDITPELQPSNLSLIEHIPFHNIEGEAITPMVPSQDTYSPVVLKQMNMPLAKLYASSKKDVHYEMLYKPNVASPSKDHPLDLYNFWGMENFAKARIIPKALLERKKDLPYSLPSSAYYLELTHHPSIAKAKIERDLYYRVRPTVGLEKSYIPLNEEHLRKIWDNIYTGRIIVKDGYLSEYKALGESPNKSFFAPKFKETIPDGMYEFFYGKLYEVGSQGLTNLAPADHPLAKFSIDKLMILYNAGIQVDNRFIPTINDQNILPARYAYFRDHNLYLMGAPIFLANDPTLEKYVEAETARNAREPNYIPFLDQGPPIKADGTIDAEKIKTYGLTVPDKQYLGLGDNHAMSGDSREFGFIPEGNIRGTPAFLFWGPGGRFGFVTDGHYPLFTRSRVLVWSLIAVGTGLYIYIRRRKFGLPLNL